MRSFSQSEITTWLTCRRKHWFAYVEGFQPKTTSLPLVYGSAFHEGMARYYSSNEVPSSKVPSVNALHGYVLDAAGMLEPTNVDVEYSSDWVERRAHVPGMLRAQLRAYMNMRSDGPYGEFKEVVYVEHRVETSIGRKARGVRFNGRFDGIVQDVHGTWWLLEHKTASSIDLGTTLNLWTDFQIGFYLLLCRLLQERGGTVFDGNPGSDVWKIRPGEFPEVRGVVYNVARKPVLRPKMIRFGTWGGFGRVGETQAEVMTQLEEAAGEIGALLPSSKKAVTWSERQETIEEYEERVYREIMREPTRYFVQEFVQRTTSEDDEFEDNLLPILRDMRHGAQYANPKHCSECWCRPVCTAPMDAREETAEVLFLRPADLPAK